MSMCVHVGECMTFGRTSAGTCVPRARLLLAQCDQGDGGELCCRLALRLNETLQLVRVRIYQHVPLYMCQLRSSCFAELSNLMNARRSGMQHSHFLVRSASSIFLKMEHLDPLQSMGHTRKIQSEIQRQTAKGPAASTPTKMAHMRECVACGEKYEGLDQLQTVTHKGNMAHMWECVACDSVLESPQWCGSHPNASWSSRTEPASTTRTPAARTSERMLGPHVYCMSEMKRLDDKHEEKLREAQTSQLKRKQTLAAERTEPASGTRTPTAATSHYMLGPHAANTNEMQGLDEDHEQKMPNSRMRQLKRKQTHSCGSRPTASWSPSSQTEPASTTRTPAASTSEWMLVSEMKRLDDEHEEKLRERKSQLKGRRTRAAERTEPTSLGRACATALTSISERDRMQDKDHEQNMHDLQTRQLKRKQTPTTEVAAEQLLGLPPRPLKRL